MDVLRESEVGWTCPPGVRAVANCRRNVYFGCDVCLSRAAAARRAKGQAGPV